MCFQFLVIVIFEFCLSVFVCISTYGEVAISSYSPATFPTHFYSRDAYPRISLPDFGPFIFKSVVFNIPDYAQIVNVLEKILCLFSE